MKTADMNRVNENAYESLFYKAMDCLNF